ncbi:MAG TPA: AAA family ATPase [Acidimicrobiia bacterium]|nr:AAA family ATPase [Acidimicrobiia bacterium]
MFSFDADHLDHLAIERGMVFPPFLVSQVVAALDAGKHIVLTGAPGTGKTTLAYLAAELGQRTLRCSGCLAVTASAEWDTSQTIGTYMDTPQGPIFHSGVFLKAIETGQWLVIDELNRSNFDRAFGPLFTVLANQSVTLPYTRAGRSQPISIVPSGGRTPEDTDAVHVPASWRLIATINVHDRDLLFQLSHALMRRFTFIEVEAPSDDEIRGLLKPPGDLVACLLPIRRVIDLGPALYLDSAQFVARRLRDPGITPSRVLYEAFYGYFLPQLDGLDEHGARQVLQLVSSVFDLPERARLTRVIRALLGSGDRRPAHPNEPERNSGEACVDA